jgi:hypothetical protein
MDELLTEIHKFGYWRVLIHPTEFQQDRIPSLSDCQEAIEKAKVSLRGWDYPHIQYDNIRRGQDWIESGIDFMGHKEYWRFYQSGQFIHHFSSREETVLSKRGLEVVATIFQFTEILEFAARLATREILSPQVTLSVTLSNIKGYSLFFENLLRLLARDYTSHIDKIEWERTLTTEEIVSKSAEIALDAVEFVFDRFGLEKGKRSIWAEDQRKLLERRL